MTLRSQRSAVVLIDSPSINISLLKERRILWLKAFRASAGRAATVSLYATTPDKFDQRHLRPPLEPGSWTSRVPAARHNSFRDDECGPRRPAARLFRQKTLPPPNAPRCRFIFAPRRFASAPVLSCPERPRSLVSDLMPWKNGKGSSRAAPPLKKRVRDCCVLRRCSD